MVFLFVNKMERRNHAAAFRALLAMTINMADLNGNEEHSISPTAFLETNGVYKIRYTG